MTEKKLAKHWWAILLRGIIAVLFAFLAFLATGFTLKLLLLFLGLYLLLDGLFAIIGGFMAAKDHKNWWLLLLEGIISIIVGIFVFALPGITLLILVYLVAIWAVITGVFEFLAGIMATWAIPGKVFIGITGVISVILGVVIFIYPVLSIVAMTWLLGIYALVIGLSLIFMSLRLKSLK